MELTHTCRSTLSKFFVVKNLSVAKDSRTATIATITSALFPSRKSLNVFFLPYVSIDDFAASRSLVEYVLSKGYRKTAIINGPREFKYSRKRLEGYKSALKNAGISVNSNYIYHVSNIHFETALPIISQLLSSATCPDALLCVSDVFAAAAVRAANVQGLSIPKDIAIAGIDDTYLAAMCTPTITCVRQPQYSLGVTACELLLERISNPYAPFRHILLPTELVVRESL